MQISRQQQPGNIQQQAPIKFRSSESVPARRPKQSKGADMDRNCCFGGMWMARFGKDTCNRSESPKQIAGSWNFVENSPAPYRSLRALRARSPPEVPERGVLQGSFEPQPKMCPKSDLKVSKKTLFGHF